MVDHQLCRRERVDPGRVALHLLHRVAHRGEVDDRGHAGEVLHQDPRRGERDLDAGLGVRVPARKRLDVLGAHRLPVLVPQQVLEQDLQRERQPRDVVARLQRVQAIDLVVAVTDGECRPGIEAVHVSNSSDKVRSGQVLQLS